MSTKEQSKKLRSLFKKAQKRAKNLPHPVETCTCKKCTTVMRLMKECEAPQLETVNDEGISVPVLLDGKFNKRDWYPDTYDDSSLETIDMTMDKYDYVSFLTCPKCLKEFNEINSPIEIAVLEKEGMCQSCRPIVYWEVYEMIPTDGGDCFRTIVLRDREEDAKAIVHVLDSTDVNWSCYGYRRVERERKPKTPKSLWAYFIEFFDR